MGKEFHIIKKFDDPSRVPFSYIDKDSIQYIIAQNWSNPLIFPSLKDIQEDGSILVIVNTGMGESSFLCKGLKHSGNLYLDLARCLENEKIIPKGKNMVNMYVQRDFLWMPINSLENTFTTNDCILVVANLKKTKCIRKLKMKKNEV